MTCLTLPYWPDHYGLKIEAPSRRNRNHQGIQDIHLIDTMAGFTTKTFTKHDDYMTPKSAWEAIKDYIPKDKVIWESFYGNGQSGKFLTELGFTVIHEDIDFFENDRGEIVVSNPPFTMKDKVLRRLIALDKPFILIMPSSTINTKYVRETLAGKLQIMIPRRRIQFQKLTDGKLEETNRCNFDCFYYCYKMDLPTDIIFLN